jgi:hypothetical protein
VGLHFVTELKAFSGFPVLSCVPKRLVKCRSFIQGVLQKTKYKAFHTTRSVNKSSYQFICSKIRTPKIVKEFYNAFNIVSSTAICKFFANTLLLCEIPLKLTCYATRYKFGGHHFTLGVYPLNASGNYMYRLL